MAKVQIYPKGGVEVKPYVNIARSLQQELELAGIEYEELSFRVAEPISTIVITIVGAVVSHWIIKLVDALIAKKKEKPDDRVQIQLIYNNIEFHLPEDRSELLKRVE